MTSFSQVFRPQAKRPKPDNQFRPLAPYPLITAAAIIQTTVTALTLFYPLLFLVKNQHALNDGVNKIFR